MRSIACLLVSLCLTASSVWPQDQPKLSPAQQEVLKVRNALRETALRRDMSAWSRYVSDDCIFSTEDGHPGKLCMLPRILQMRAKQLGVRGEVHFQPDGAK